MARVVIVGAGISGLSIAYRLRQLGPHHDVVVLDQADRPGGTLWTLQRDGFQVETGANGFLDSKSTTLELCRELGLGDRLIEASAAAGKNRYLFLDGKLRPLPGSLGGLIRATDLLSWRGKLSFLLERFRRRPRQWSDESIAAFARRRAGQEVTDVFADAMVTGIYAGDPELLSLTACFPRVSALEREHGSVLKGFGKAAKKRRQDAQQRGEIYRRPGTMWSLTGGLRVLVEALRNHLNNRLVLGARMRRLEKTSENQRKWRVHDGQNTWDADVVVLACPAYAQAALLAEVDRELSARIAEIPYNRLAVIALGYRREDVPIDMAGFGFIAPQRLRRDLLGVQWCSSIFPGRAPDGAVLLRAMCGGWHRADMLDWDDERLTKSVRAELRLAMGIEAAPFFQEIIRWDRAIPQYHVGHLERLAWLEKRLPLHPGLYLAGNAYHGVSLNDCTEQGAVLARKIVDLC